MHDERLQATLDFAAQFGDAFLAARVIPLKKFRNLDWLVKMNEHVAAIPFLCRIGQADWSNSQSKLATVSLLEFQGHPRRASLDRFELRIVGTDAFRKNAYCTAILENFEARLERGRHRAHRPGIVLQPVDRNDPALFQEPGQRREAEELHRGHKVDLPRNGSANDKRIG